MNRYDKMMVVVRHYREMLNDLVSKENLTILDVMDLGIYSERMLKYVQEKYFDDDFYSITRNQYRLFQAWYYEYLSHLYDELTKRQFFINRQ